MYLFENRRELHLHAESNPEIKNLPVPNKFCIDWTVIHFQKFLPKAVGGGLGPFYLAVMGAEPQGSLSFPLFEVALIDNNEFDKGC